MKRIECDLAIVGSGFGGTLLALVAQRLGLTTALLERGQHPRFAIGESSTPLADFKLADIAHDFQLDWLRPLSKYGTWKATYPHLPCGLKRGFSFFRHAHSQPFTPQPGNANLLLVAASPDEARADTHWLRADFDAHLVHQAVAAGIPYLDRLDIAAIHHNEPGWQLQGTQPEGDVSIRANFVVDATGDGQLLGRALSLQAVAPAQLLARSRALYSHFTGVASWHDLLEDEHGPTATHGYPFRADAAALHQIIDGGWMWVLRFDHGITSAGFSLDPEVHPLCPAETPEMEWTRLLAAYPSLARQFARAEPVRPFVRTGRLQRRLSRAAGSDWALLPHAAGFLDAWLSPGIAQTLFAIHRLARALADGPGRARRLADYDRAVVRELAWVDQLTGTCFACFDRFEVMTTVSMLYFVAAIYGEERARSGQAGPDDAFLLADDPTYRALADHACQQALTVRPADAAAFATSVRRAIEPYNLAGLCDPARGNLYPFIQGKS
jgi:FADH2 O2-dependent halogenase